MARRSLSPKNTRLVIIRINIFRGKVTDRGFSRATKRSRSSHEPRGGPCHRVLVVEPVSLFVYALSSAPRLTPAFTIKPHHFKKPCWSVVRGFWANVISKKR